MRCHPLLRTVPLALLLLALPLAHADEASKRVKIHQLFAAMHLDQTMAQMMNMSMAQGEAMGKSIAGTGKTLTPADQKLLDNYLAKVKALVTDTLSWDKLEPAYVDLYAKTFTEPEIEGTLAYYNSSAGKAFVEKTPDLLKQSQTVVLSRAQDLGPKMQALTQEFSRQMEEAHKAAGKSS